MAREKKTTARALYHITTRDNDTIRFCFGINTWPLYLTLWVARVQVSPLSCVANLGSCRPDLSNPMVGD